MGKARQSAEGRSGGCPNCSQMKRTTSARDLRYIRQSDGCGIDNTTQPKLHIKKKAKTVMLYIRTECLKGESHEIWLVSKLWTFFISTFCMCAEGSLFYFCLCVEIFYTHIFILVWKFLLMWKKCLVTQLNIRKVAFLNSPVTLKIVSVSSLW
jgi:hypothetical protein